MAPFYIYVEPLGFERPTDTRIVQRWAVFNFGIDLFTKTGKLFSESFTNRKEEFMEGMIETGVFVTEDEKIELATCSLDPNASRFSPRKRKEPYEVLQEQAARHGLPLLSDMYGLTNSGQIVCRDTEINRRKLETFLKGKEVAH